VNYLAHLLLSGADPDWQLGGFLGDFVKGPLATATDARGQPWAPAVVQGMRLHRHLDGWIDSHPLQLTSRTRLGADLRRVSGIVLDIAFDHFLARHWARFHPEALAGYERRVMAQLLAQQPRLSPAAQTFLARAESSRLLCRYAEREVLAGVLGRVAARLRPGSQLELGFDRIVAAYGELEEDFLVLMPLLQAYAAATRAAWRTAAPDAAQAAVSIQRP
jgi:acyl carrier protein phosphodiesterase